MARTAFVAIVTLAIAFALVPAAAVGQSSAAPGAEYVIGFRHAPDAAWASSHGFAIDRNLPALHALVVRAADAGMLRAAARANSNIAFVEPNQRLHVDSAGWDGTGWDATGWDGTGWDATGWDATGWDGTGWDGTGWDGTGWDGTGWDGTGWDGTGWDGTGWDGTGWDATGWDGTGWDATGWDGTGWDGTGWDGTGWDGTGWDSASADPGYAAQWGLGAAHVPDAWNVTHGTRAVTVCVLDTGVDASHPDLAANLYTAADGSHGYNAMDGSSNVSDDVGHGTFVAGILAAAGGNSLGIIGVAQEIVYPVKVMNAAGGTEADLATGIQACVDHGSRVISMSLHTTQPSELLNQSLASAEAAGVVLVAAAGNDGSDQVAFPASYPGVIAVGAATLDAQLAGFSAHGNRLDLVAPGVDVAGTLPGGTYGRANGTSMAAPFVSGTAALMLEANPSLTAAQVASIMESTAHDWGAAGRDATFGYGALDTGASLKAAMG